MLPLLLRRGVLPTNGPARTFSTSLARSDHGIKHAGVVGAGQMGIGIAYVIAKTAKVNVVLADANPAALEKGWAFVDKLVKKDVAKNKITEEEGVALRGRMRGVGGVEEMGECDIVIEAAPENLPLKTKIFKSLAGTLGPNAILASNTSSISLSSIAAAASGAGADGRVVGFHFFNPVPVMKLCELIPALQTTPKTLERAREFAVAMGKTVVTSKDTPGFISNRLLMPFINEAIIVLESGIATKEDIDTTLKLGMAHPMGPLALADFIGLDTCLSIQQTLYAETSDTKYRPSILLGRMVAAGYMGKKSGKGFYDY